MKHLFKSLAAFQQEVPVIHKGTQGFSYSYADLPAILEVINPLLKKHGLGFTQLVGNGEIKTIVFHVESAEQIETTTTIPQGVELRGMNQYQTLGSAITYIRRYALSAMLVLVTDKDTDAAGEPVKVEVKKAKATATTLKAMIDACNSGQKEKVKASMDKYEFTPEQLNTLNQYIN